MGDQRRSSCCPVANSSITCRSANNRRAKLLIALSLFLVEAVPNECRRWLVLVASLQVLLVIG